MPSLAELTDGYSEPQTLDSLPVKQPYLGVPAGPDGMRRVYITKSEATPDLSKPITDNRPEPRPEPGYTDEEYFSKPIAPMPELPEGNAIERIIKKFANTEFSKGHPLANQLFGTGGEERYQLWPERMVREGVAAPGEVAAGKVPQYAIDPETGDVHTSPQMIEKALAVSALAGSGGLGGVTDATLGSTPFLRPALKYKDRLYKGKEGQQHLDVIPADLYPTFQQKAMSGEDIKDFNFGFINDKGKFLSRQDALEYGINTGLIDPQAGKYGALTSTLMADSSKPGVAIESMKQAPAFYSAVEHQVNAIPQAKMTGEQWLGTLSNKPGVKPEELQWSGLKDFLEENKGKPVSKAQIEEHLAGNKVELKEVEKGTTQELIDLKKEHKELSDKSAVVPPGKERDRLKARFDEISNKLDKLEENGQTKYHGYQLPGGENYREMLLTLPSQNKMKWERTPEGITSEGYTIKKEPNGYVTYGSGGRKLSLHDSEEMAKSLVETSKSNSPNTQMYRSSHWDEPNILAHVRMNDRTIDGKKSLHMEEIQSDWHQQGRDKGYQNNNKTPDNPSGAPKFGEVPDAPFKKSWHELALKRMIREAAEKGYDRLSWTPGEAQAARYDLSKQIDRVQYHSDKQRLVAFDKNGNLKMDESIAPEKVADYVGKDLAEKLFKTPKMLGIIHTLENADLKIGGEGMKGFYDKMIPNALEKIGKEHGVKVKSGEIESPYYGTGQGNIKIKIPTKHKIHYIDIPQSLRDQAMHKGFPLFSAGGHMLIPVNHNPFEDKK